MRYKCKSEDGCWIAEAEQISEEKDSVEIVAKGRGSCLNVVIGKCSTGNYLFIPQYECGCQLADLNDTFWNTERLSAHIGDTDAITIITGIKELFG